LALVMQYVYYHLVSLINFMIRCQVADEDVVSSKSVVCGPWWTTTE